MITTVDEYVGGRQKEGEVKGASSWEPTFPSEAAGNVVQDEGTRMEKEA